MKQYINIVNLLLGINPKDKECKDLKKAKDGSTALEADQHKYYQLAVRDTLTGLFNRQYVEDAVGRLIGMQARHASSLMSLLLVKVDRFDEIVNRYGQLGADVVMRRVGSLLGDETNQCGLAARFSVDNFAVFFAGLSAQECGTYIEHICAAADSMRFEQTLAALTVKVRAIAIEHRIGEGFADMLKRAELALSTS